MTEERLRFIRSLDSLAPLSDHTDVIHVNTEGRVEVEYQISPPNDEYGIPRPEIMIDRLLAQLATKNFVWSGRFDEHHLATPKADFSIVRTPDEGDIGSAFRGLSCLKIELPRQMHNFAHAIFELPGRPSLEVMRQAVTEVGQARQLQEIINEHSPVYPHLETEQMRYLCMSALQGTIERMQEPEVGMMPPLESLVGMDFDTLRQSVNAILRVRRFSEKALIHPAIRKSGKYRQNVARIARTAA